MDGKMPAPVVPTKISVPPVQRELAGRPRLMERLARGLDSKLILVSAPAGYGKTVLLAAWAAQCGMPVAWVSLEDSDNDPARFLSALTAALEKARPGSGLAVRKLLESPQILSWDELLFSLLNELSDLDAPFVLVLDDYHLIHEPVVHTLTINLIHQLPGSVHPVIASRADPPLQIARLRARNELTELHLADLCFTPEEAALFFNQVMKLGLTGEQVYVLNSRAEGWVAGLQLAALSMETVLDRQDFIRSFSGSNRFILDYLVDEVLKGQTGEFKQFLIQTSILDRLTGPLCDVVTRRNDSQQILERLEQANLFLIPLDTDRAWYRYHQLFRDLLRKQANNQPPEELADLYQRAAQWFSSAGMVEEAVEYSLASGDLQRSAGLIKTAAPVVLMRGEIYTFKGWVKRLPEDVLLADSDLALYYAWTLVIFDDAAETLEDWLRRLDQNSPLVIAKSTVVRGFLEYMRGNSLNALSLLQTGLAGLPVGEDFFRPIVDYALSSTYVMLGDLNAGARALEKAAQSAIWRGQVSWAARAICELGEIHIRRGELHAARIDFERAVAVAVDDHGRPLPVAGRAYMRLGELWREWNDLNRATQECQEGIDLAKRLRESAALSGYLTLAEILQYMGDAEGARNALHTAEELAHQTPATDLDDLIVACFGAELALRQGQLSVVQAWVSDRRLEDGFDPSDLECSDDFYKYHVLKYELLALARWRLACGKPQDALAVLDILRQKMEAQGRIHLIIEILLVSALAYVRLGDPGQAQHLFERSLALAEPGGYVRLYLDEGAALRELLARAAQEGPHSTYASRLLAALELETQAAPADFSWQAQPAGAPEKQLLSLAGVAPVDALTGRELELLNLIAEGLSNQDIARRLYISLPTVKWHTSHIFAKLGVRSRTQAVVKARSLGYLDSPDTTAGR
jgi:LuxR family maltose regulon positive regulatory protein